LQKTIPATQRQLILLIMAAVLSAFIKRTPLVMCLDGADVTTAGLVLHLILLPNIYRFVEAHSLPTAAGGGGGAGGFLVAYDDVSRSVSVVLWCIVYGSRDD
jgi:hypothetical protein